jgi:hypothetical protein
MKYLKKFNESNSFYSTVSYVEMEDLRSHNRELFNDDEVNSIISKLDNLFDEKYYKIEGNKRVGVEAIEIRDKQYGPSDVKFYISKYEDEWYGIEYYKAVALKYQITYYKCDQFEGLLKFLDDIKKPLN